MGTPIILRQDAYTITKNNNTQGTVEHSEVMKRVTEHIYNLISEITLLNTEIYIKISNLVKVHLNKLDEPKIK